MTLHIHVRRTSLDWAIQAEDEKKAEEITDPIFLKLKACEQKAEQLIEQLKEAKQNEELQKVKSILKDFQSLQKKFQKREKKGSFSRLEGSQFADLVNRFHQLLPEELHSPKKLKRKSCTIL